MQARRADRELRARPRRAAHDLARGARGVRERRRRREVAARARERAPVPRAAGAHVPIRARRRRRARGGRAIAGAAVRRERVRACGRRRAERELAVRAAERVARVRARRRAHAVLFLVLQADDDVSDGAMWSGEVHLRLHSRQSPCARCCGARGRGPQ